MTASAPQELPVVDVPLVDLDHIKTRTGNWKLTPVLAGLRAGATLPPIWISRDSADSPWQLDDGNHRLCAARQLGHAAIRAIVATGAEQIRLAEQLWRIGAIGVSDAEARSAVRRHRAAITRCGLAHLFPDLMGTTR